VVLDVGSSGRVSVSVSVCRGDDAGDVRKRDRRT